MITKTKTELALALGHSMHELRIFLRQYIQVRIKAHGVDITFEMLEVLSFLWKKDGANQQEIADMTLRDKSSMTYLIDNLAKRNMVRRVEDENDRRNKLIFLTDEAKALKDQLQSWVAEVYEKATVNIDENAIEAAQKLIGTMVQNLKI